MSGNVLAIYDEDDLPDFTRKVVLNAMSEFSERNGRPPKAIHLTREQLLDLIRATERGYGPIRWIGGTSVKYMGAQVVLNDEPMAPLFPADA